VRLKELVLGMGRLVLAIHSKVSELIVGPTILFTPRRNKANLTGLSGSCLAMVVVGQRDLCEHVVI